MTIQGDFLDDDEEEEEDDEEEEEEEEDEKGVEYAKVGTAFIGDEEIEYEVRVSSGKWEAVGGWNGVRYWCTVPLPALRANRVIVLVVWSSCQQRGSDRHELLVVFLVNLVLIYLPNTLIVLDV